MGSREMAVDYMTPLGLHHQMAESHYGPAPWLTAEDAQEPSTPVYFNRADAHGIGFDRTATGSNALAQYAPAAAAQIGNLTQESERFLLWFHHVPWDHRMSSGRTVWDELVVHYTRGVQRVADMRRTWAGLAGLIDA